jgi:hypothetical protein
LPTNLKALVKAQTAVLAMFTVRRDKTSTVWGIQLMDLKSKSVGHGNADSRERWKARATFQQNSMKPILDEQQSAWPAGHLVICYKTALNPHLDPLI